MDAPFPGDTISTTLEIGKSRKPGGRTAFTDQQLDNGDGTKSYQLGVRRPVVVDRNPAALGSPAYTAPLLGAGGVSIAAPTTPPVPTGPVIEDVPFQAPQVIEARALVTTPQPAVVVPSAVQTAYVPPVPKTRTKVILVSEAAGKMTLFCDGVSISDSVLMVIYSNDGQTSIYEPPVCTEESPLKVIIGERTYFCLSGGWSTELADQYFVILLRLPDRPATLA